LCLFFCLVWPSRTFGLRCALETLNCRRRRWHHQTASATSWSSVTGPRNGSVVSAFSKTLASISTSISTYLLPWVLDSFFLSFF
jgi:hypothetical protein